MQITVTGRHVDVTDNIRNHVEAKVEQDLGIFRRIESVHVILDVEKHRRLAEVVIQGKAHIRVDAKAESDDLYASIDSAVEKAARQMERIKDKIENHKTHEGLGELERTIMDQHVEQMG